MSNQIDNFKRIDRRKSSTEYISSCSLNYHLKSSDLPSSSLVPGRVLLVRGRCCQKASKFWTQPRALRASRTEGNLPRIVKVLWCCNVNNADNKQNGNNETTTIKKAKMESQQIKLQLQQLVLHSYFNYQRQTTYMRTAYWNNVCNDGDSKQRAQRASDVSAW